MGNDESTEEPTAEEIAAEEKREKAIEKKTPAYLLNEPPPSGQKTNYIKWCLLHGKTELELKAEPDVSPRSVDICAQELEKTGLRQRIKEILPPKDLTVPPGGTKSVHVFAKGSPPEALIDSINLPLLDGKDVGFERGLKFGATMIVLGVRVAQELSNLGVQQARPIMEMAKTMREGETAAAKTAASDAAIEAAGLVAQQFGPAIAGLSKPPSGPNPMQEMMTRLMEPVIQQAIGKMMPGVGGVGGAAGGQLPSGWTRKSG